MLDLLSFIAGAAASAIGSTCAIWCRRLWRRRLALKAEKVLEGEDPDTGLPLDRGFIAS